MNIVLLEAVAWGKMEVSGNFADLQVAPNVAALVQLLLEFVCPPF